MATPNSAGEQEWSMLAGLGDEDREAEMLQRFVGMAALEEEERLRQLLAMAQAEYAVSNEGIRAFTVSRLRVWLRMEPEAAERVSHSYQAAMQKIPGDQAMRRITLDQTLAREFSIGDQERLVALAPRVFGGIASAAPSQASQQAPQPEAPAKKRWWPFGKR